MLPKIIVHNMISLDGCLIDFDIDMELYYEIAGKFSCDGVLVGSRTAEAGLGMFMDTLPKETENDWVKPKNNEKPPFIIPDSRGRLQGKLHAFRNSEFCGDIIVLVGSNTPKQYLDYLRDREYEVIIAGHNHVSYPQAFEQLADSHNIHCIRADSGGVLNCLLLEQRLVDELSFIVAPYIVGGKHHVFFDTLKLSKTLNLELVHCAQLRKGHVWLRYIVI